mgnify:CR=1 FL=1
MLMRDRTYKHFNANYYLHNRIIEYYKNDFKFLDLNEVLFKINSLSYNSLTLKRYFS